LNENKEEEEEEEEEKKGEGGGEGERKEEGRGRRRRRMRRRRRGEEDAGGDDDKMTNSVGSLRTAKIAFVFKFRYAKLYGHARLLLLTRSVKKLHTTYIYIL
jgi:hypothetical protein